MKKTVRALATLSTVILVVGCIVSDELTTITIQPDGSADIVKFRSNIRSTEKGTKAEEELRRYVEAFDGRKDEDSIQITQVGGEVLEARWVRRELPYSNLFSARLPHATALEKFCTIEGKEGELQLSARFSQDGARRKFSWVLTPQKDLKLPEPSVPALKELRQKQANGISETRFVVANGNLVSSQGFTVADDKRSALLATEELEELLRAGRQRVEFFLEWSVNADEK